MPRVYNKYHGDAPADAVYVGRPHPLGNPYKIGPITRDEAVDAYRRWLVKQVESGLVNLEPLRGKDLVCWCAPKRCHADVILEMANA